MTFVMMMKIKEKKILHICIFTHDKRKYFSFLALGYTSINFPKKLFTQGNFSFAEWEIFSRARTVRSTVRSCTSLWRWWWKIEQDHSLQHGIENNIKTSMSKQIFFFYFEGNWWEVLHFLRRLMFCWILNERCYFTFSIVVVVCARWYSLNWLVNMWVDFVQCVTCFELTPSFVLRFVLFLKYEMRTRNHGLHRHLITSA